MAKRYMFIVGAVALGGLSIGTVRPAQAGAVVLGTFSGVIGTTSESNFAGPFDFNDGDAITGSFAFDPDAILTTLTTTLTDTTTGSAFTIPAAGNVSVTSVGATATDYTVTQNDDLEFPSTLTPFTTDFALDLSGSLVAGALAQTALFSAGTGSLDIDVPAEGGIHSHPEETLDVPFTVTSGSIPEPASITILGVGLLGLLRSRRRKAG